MYSVYPNKQNCEKVGIPYPTLENLEVPNSVGWLFAFAWFVIVSIVIFILVICSIYISSLFGIDFERFVEKTTPENDSWLNCCPIIPFICIGVLIWNFVINPVINIYKSRKLEKDKEKYKQAEKRVKQSEKSRVHWKTNQLNKIYSSTESSVIEINELLKKIEFSLVKAQIEFKKNAYVPFWQAIEDTKDGFAEFQRKTATMSNYADNYYKDLEDEFHNFPIPLPIGLLHDDANNIFKDFVEIIEESRPNKDFSDILVNGFPNLMKTLKDFSSIKNSITVLYKIASHK